MSTPIIRADRVAKEYVLGGPARRTNSLREAMTETARGLLRPRTRTPAPRFWALDDVSFDVAPGEVLGIIGRNGAGKSTLLKVLSRITEPTRGRIELRGRAASLLEVGTGFHPELTGRENVFLNGTILGMRKKEVERKFDEIVEFAEVAQFIDTPVKRYSSGMYVRLAFAVAAHLEPEILVVDEVLAVGDAEFQKKCLGKMGDVAHQGRTVLFVSHNMAAMRALCPRSLYLRKGKVAFDGPTERAVAMYLAEATGSGDAKTWSYRKRGAKLSVESAELLVNGEPSQAVQAGDACTIRIRYRTSDPAVLGTDGRFFVMLFGEGQKLTNLWTDARMGHGVPLAEEGTVECTIPRWPYRGMPMRADLYTEVGFEAQDWIEEMLTFDSHDGDFYGTGTIPFAGQGVMFVDHDWSADTLHAGERDDASQQRAAVA